MGSVKPTARGNVTERLLANKAELYKGVTRVVLNMAEYQLGAQGNAQALVETEQDNCVRFEEGLRYELRVLISSHRERVLVVLIDKEKIIEDVKRTKCKKIEQKRAQGKAKRET